MRDIIEPQGPPEPGEEPAPIGRRLGWFALIAASAAAMTALAAYGLKALLPAH